MTNEERYRSALEDARHFVSRASREFNHPNFTDRYGDGPEFKAALERIDAALSATPQPDSILCQPVATGNEEKYRKALEELVAVGESHYNHHCQRCIAAMKQARESLAGVGRKALTMSGRSATPRWKKRRRWRMRNARIYRLAAT